MARATQSLLRFGEMLWGEVMGRSHGVRGRWRCRGVGCFFPNRRKDWVGRCVGRCRWEREPWGGDVSEGEGRKDWEKSLGEIVHRHRKCRQAASFRSYPQAMAREMAWCWVLLRWEKVWGWDWEMLWGEAIGRSHGVASAGGVRVCGVVHRLWRPRSVASPWADVSQTGEGIGGEVVGGSSSLGWGDAAGRSHGVRLGW
jgi:hypothetical protein